MSIKRTLTGADNLHDELKNLLKTFPNSEKYICLIAIRDKTKIKDIRIINVVGDSLLNTVALFGSIHELCKETSNELTELVSSDDSNSELNKTLNKTSTGV